MQSCRDFCCIHPLLSPTFLGLSPYIGQCHLDGSWLELQCQHSDGRVGDLVSTCLARRAIGGLIVSKVLLMNLMIVPIDVGPPSTAFECYERNENLLIA